MFRRICILIALSLLFAPYSLQAQTVLPAPALLNFQGRLTRPDGTPAADAINVTLRFSLWDAASGGNEKWNQTLNNVTVRNGAFAVLLSGFAANTFAGDLWMEIKIGSDAPLSPRQQLVSVAFAMKANTVPDGSLTSAKFVGGVLTPGGPAGGDLTGNYPNPILKNNIVTTPKIADNAITRPKLADNAIGYTELLFDDKSLGKMTGNTLAQSAGNIVIGGTGANNPHSFSRLLNVIGVNSGAAPGTSAIVYTDPVNGRSWSAGITTDGNFTFFKSGSGTNRVVVPVLQVTGGSDVAEPFNVREDSAVKPGMVVTIDPERVGELRLSTSPYDRAVAGIISGAGGVKPGMTLTQTGTEADGKHPVALTGRVWCWCDADANGPIAPGDLLTTSSTRGHAMRVTDHARANGAVIGKAMSSLNSGKGLVLVLVSLK